MVDTAAIVTAARGWVGTPYHHMARVKGAGCDCGQLLVASFAEAREIEDFDPGFYTSDWHLHRDEDRYLALVERYLRRVGGDTELPLSQRLADDTSWTLDPADVIVFRVGRCFSHGAIVTSWPNIVHAYLPSGIVEEVSILGTPMAARPMRVYRKEDS